MANVSLKEPAARALIHWIWNVANNPHITLLYEIELDLWGNHIVFTLPRKFIKTGKNPRILMSTDWIDFSEEHLS